MTAESIAISNSGSKVEIIVNEGQPRFKGYEDVNWRFLSDTVIEFNLSGEVVSCLLANVTVNGDTPADKADAIAKLAAEFPESRSAIFPIKLTRSQAQDLMDASRVKPGVSYSITDFSPIHETVEALLTGSTNPKQFLRQGYGKFYVPNFQQDGELTANIYGLHPTGATHGEFAVGDLAHTDTSTGKIIGQGNGLIWYQLLTGTLPVLIIGSIRLTNDSQDAFIDISSASEPLYFASQHGIWNADDKANDTYTGNNSVIWNNSIYIVIGNDFDGSVPADAPNSYLLLPKGTEYGYKEDIDIIEIDWEHNHIDKRICKRRNSVGAEWGSIGAECQSNFPIPFFQWGNDAARGNEYFNQYIDWRNYIPGDDPQDNLVNYGKSGVRKDISIGIPNVLKQIDNGKTLYTNSSEINGQIHVPSGLALPFFVLVIDSESVGGRPYVTSDSYVSNRSNFTKSAGTDAGFTIVVDDVDGNCHVFGDLQSAE